MENVQNPHEQSPIEQSHDHDHDHRHDFGLSYDLTELKRRIGTNEFPVPTALVAGLDRRHLLKFALVASVAGVATLGMRRTAQAQTTATCTDIPEETAGPFPGDGTNGPNVLTATGVVRNDITTSFAGMTGTAAGVALRVTLSIIDAATCGPAKGYAVYLWHADQLGRYSLYSAGVTNQNYLRGVQETDASGNVTFNTIFPACYDGRWPHIHFEVYPSLQAAGDASKRIATSQLALPKATCDLVYATTGYTASPANLAKVSLATDGVFSDDSGSRELATVTGNVANGFAASLTATVSNTVKASGGGFGGRGPGAVTPTTVAKKVVATTKKKTKRTATTVKKKK